MNKINWCLNKKGGLEIIEPNSNLSKAYIIKSEEALKSLKLNVVKDWKISTAYYTIYFAIYSILTKIGIKSEIHSCTLEFAKKFLHDYFDTDELEFFEKTLKARIDSQYYIDRTVPDKQYDEIIKRAPQILVKCKSILTKLNEDKILKIRESIKNEK
jgi:uncharacterized protein (UPF0332 family)